MAQARWTHHLIFMQEVHQKVETIFNQARKAYREHGLGTMHVDREQWMQVVRDAVTDEEIAGLPHTYMSAQQATERCDFGLLAGGFTDIISSYDPSCAFVLTVEHHPQGLLSCYVIDPSGKGQEVIR